MVSMDEALTENEIQGNNFRDTYLKILPQFRFKLSYDG
jgi:hypothetical protein